MVASVAGANTVEEVGLASPECVIDQIPDNGRWEWRAVCTFSTVDDSGTVIRSNVRYSLREMSNDNYATVEGCLDIAWAALYASEGFEVPGDPGIPPAPDPTFRPDP